MFYFEETELPVIRHKDEIWIKANTVADILGYKNSMKSIRDHVDPEDKRRLSELAPNPKVTKGPNRTKRSPKYKLMRKAQFILTSPDYTVSYFALT